MMRLLANENFPGDAVTALRQQGHDVAWIRTDSPGISDVEVLERAQRKNRVVVTFDKDFGELAFRLRLRALSGIILFRISAPSSQHVAQAAVAAIASRTDWEDILLWLKIIASALHRFRKTKSSSHLPSKATPVRGKIGGQTDSC